MPKILHCEFEVFGVVQGVSFRMVKKTKRQSIKGLNPGGISLPWIKFYTDRHKVKHMLEKQAKSLGVRGWCMNTPNDTVKGEMEAPPDKFDQMKNWLEKTGSPTSRIDKVIFSDTRELDSFTFESFNIRY